MNAGEIMTRDVATVTPNETLEQAAQLMWEADCGAIPVVDGGGMVVGIVTDRDVAMATLIQGRLLSEIPVMSIAAPEPCIAREDEPVELVESLMRNHQVRRVPIVDHEQRLVGIVSLNDIARHARHDGTHHDALSPEVVASTLAAICTPRAA
jgi:CBS domain-containing protein